MNRRIFGPGPCMVLLVLILSVVPFMASCSSAEEAPIEVREVHMDTGLYNSIRITCLVDSITITGLHFNRKEIQADLIPLPKTLSFGEWLSRPYPRNLIREVQVDTDKGSWTFNFK